MNILPQVKRKLPKDRDGFDAMLRDWLQNSPARTISGTDKSDPRPWVWVAQGGEIFHLNADTTRAGVREYVDMAARSGGRLVWTIVRSKRRKDGKCTKVVFGTERRPIPGFYLYRPVPRRKSSAASQTGRQDAQAAVAPAVQTSARIAPPISNSSLPEYVEARIRQPVPADAAIVLGSTPVVSFGDFRKAAVATLGINPSNREFTDLEGKLLTGALQRLQTLQSLGIEDLTSAPADAAERVWKWCAGYFDRNPYRGWFDRLEPILGRLGASYYDGSACHLDLVQWATDPKWSGLPSKVREQLLRRDSDFLWKQLTKERISLLLLNGRTVIRTFSRHYGVELRSAGFIDGHRHSVEVVSGRAAGLRVVGWSANIQGPFGVSNAMRERIADRVLAMAGGRVGEWKRPGA